MASKEHQEPVYLLQLYLSKLPQSAFQRDIFYMKARTCIPDSPSDPWFTDIPVGHNTLDKFLKQILTEASVDTTNKSNHSLRATAICRMYQKNVPEKLIMERSGHISREGVTSYERTTPAQQKAVCKMLSNVPEKPSPSADGIPLPEVHSLDATSSHSHPPPTIKQEDAIDTPTAVDIPTAVQENASDIMKKLQFSNMTSCTFNINFKV